MPYGLELIIKPYSSLIFYPKKKKKKWSAQKDAINSSGKHKQI